MKNKSLKDIKLSTHNPPQKTLKSHIETTTTAHKCSTFLKGLTRHTACLFRPKTRENSSKPNVPHLGIVEVVY
jgi:hypothetical protein